MVDEQNVLPRLVFENTLATATTVIPIEITVEDGVILWKRRPVDEWSWPLHGFQTGGPVDGALWRFLELSDAEDRQFIEFIQMYGVLGLRVDGLPHTAHREYGEGEEEIPQERGPDGTWWFREEIATWKMYADGLRAILAFARELPFDADVASIFRKYRLRNELFSFYGLPEMEDANHVSAIHARWMQSSPLALADALSRQATAKQRRSCLSWFITDQWINPSSLKPTIGWTEDDHSLQLTLGNANIYSTVPENSLYRILISQLVSTMTSEPIERLDICTVCNRLFIPVIRPGRHSHSYCPDHKLEGDRDRKRRWARKAAAQKRAATSG